MGRINTSCIYLLCEHLSRSRLRFAIPPLVAVIAWAVWVGVAGIASGHLPLAENTQVYDLVFSAFTFLGFYLECVLVATVFYVILRVVVILRRTNTGEGGSAK